jgi:hypothetical protein
MTTSPTGGADFAELAFAFHVTRAALAAGMTFAVLMGIAGGFRPGGSAAAVALKHA